MAWCFVLRCGVFSRGAAVVWAVLRGDFYPCSRSEYESLKAQLEYEKTPDGQNFHDLQPLEQAAKVKARVKSYCQRVSALIILPR